MNIIIFGPPGIGKSTIVAKHKAHGGKAIDLEDIYPNEIRHNLPRAVDIDGVIFGGADLDPAKDYGPNTIKVLLVASQKHYYERRRQRDGNQPEKAAQREHFIGDWLADRHLYDYICWTDLPERNVNDVTKLLAKLLKKGKKGGSYAV